ncbi:protein SIEVE ELEMENT OCCLUSION B-like [Momordica charantia]|uniref:Protein SIEVE ELEMENT OCCLUSION B-like n=1 Tax=Momordica charantia TaxID=3673 RepID=A0A6J1C9Z3_MOMCH|nr:protein SIEVE ELEMENT OCCLUSION B-like [Momordica charantia]
MSLLPPKNSTTSLVHPNLQNHKEETSLEHFSDDVITDYIYTKHREDDKIKIDVDNYISLVESIIITADRITDSVSRVIEGRMASGSDSSLNLPLCTLHRISSELACKAPGIGKAHETTMEILDILISYPWEAKAILALAAFATDYGDLWHLNYYFKTDPLARTLAIIKQVPELKKHLYTPKYRQVFLSPRCLIHGCLQAIKYMIEIKNFSKYDIKELTELSSAIRQIPLITYWIIHIIVASRTEISGYLTATQGQSQNYLNELTEKIRSILFTLENHLNIIREQQEEINLYKWLMDHVDNFPTELSLVLSKLIEGKMEAKPFIDGSTRKKVSVENSLRRKKVILVISGLNISEEDIKALHIVYNELHGEDKYKIVWIPIINPNDVAEENKQRYEDLVSKMPWYIVQYTEKIAGWRFLEENWQLRDDPLVVVLNSQSKVEFTNAIHLIRVWGSEAIPFTNQKLDTLLRKNWPESTILKFTHHPRLNSWINQDKSIIFYGGKDPKWIQQFEDKVIDIKNDSLLRAKGITFEIVRIGKNIAGEDDPRLMSRFWVTQWGFFIVKSQIRGSSASETTEDILRLISYENENGWGVVTVGSAPLLVGRGDLILAVLEDFRKWKQILNLKGFGDSFKDYFNELAVTTHQCDRVTLPGFSGWIPMVVNCPECPRFMETGINFKCCHGRTHM